MRAFRLCIALTTTIAASIAAALPAQDLLAPPPDLNLDELGELPRSLLRPNSGVGVPSQAISRGQAELIEPGMVLNPIPDDRTMIYDPAVVWSSRSWLDRGYWYAVDEALITVRTFDKKNVLLARDITNGPDGIPSGRSLQLRAGRPGAVANAKLTLGRFLFRDTENRDHSAEVSFLGFGKEIQRDNVTSLLPNNLETGPTRLLFNNVGTIPIAISGSGLALDNLDFDGSNSQTVAYTHEFESLEFNYRVKQRKDRDWMTLRPDGQWVRQAPPGMVFEYMAGIRWMSADEWLNWNASGGRSGFMNIKANNDLLGVQLGAGASQSFARWEVSCRGVAGAYTNFARVNRDFELRNQPAMGPSTLIISDSVRAEEETLAFIGEYQSVLRYHIHQNFALRLGHQITYLDSMAIAPFQMTFTPQFNQVGVSGSSFYHGFLVGIDGYW